MVAISTTGSGWPKNYGEEVKRFRKYAVINFDTLNSNFCFSIYHTISDRGTHSIKLKSKNFLSFPFHIQICCKSKCTCKFFCTYRNMCLCTSEYECVLAILPVFWSPYILYYLAGPCLEKKCNQKKTILSHRTVTKTQIDWDFKTHGN